MLAWGLANGQFTPDELARKAAAAGYAWAALELDDAETMAFNRAAWPDFRTALHARGLLALSWFTEGGNLKDTPKDADGTIAELEGDGDYQGILYCEQNGLVPPVPKAVCTNFNLLTPERAKPLIDAGYACLTECYMGESVQFNPDAMDNTARWRGWSTSQPVFGVYNAPASTYDPWRDWPGVDYLGEYVL